MCNAPNQKIRLLAIVALSCCFFLSSCSNIPYMDTLLSGSSSSIKSTVSNFLDQISTGVYANHKYVCSSSKDTKFADLEFTYSDAAKVMDAGMRKMTYMINDAHGSTKSMTGTCNVTITTVDLDEVLSNMKNTEVQKDTLLDVFSSNDVPTTESKITLALSYDSSLKVWSILDIAPLVDILGTPYTKIVLFPDKGSPGAAVESLLSAVVDRDKTAAKIASSYCDDTDCLFGDSDTEKYYDAYFSRLSYTYIKEEYLSDSFAKVTYNITTPDSDSILTGRAADVECVADEMKPTIIASLRGTDKTAAQDECWDMYINDISERITVAPRISTEVVFELKTDKQSGKWSLYNIPNVLYDIYYACPVDDVTSYKALFLATDTLLREGSISRDEYDYLINYYIESIDPEMIAKVKGYAYEGNWSLPGKNFVDSTFDASTTTGIEYWLFFDQGIPEETTFTYEWYNKNGAKLYNTSTELVERGSNAIDPCLFPPTYGDTMPPDTYRLVVKINDGTVIADVTAVVK